MLVNANLVSVNQSRKTGLKIWREYENMIGIEVKSRKEEKRLTWFQGGGAHLIHESCAVTMLLLGRSKLEGYKKQPCERCGFMKVLAHHENYDEPLNVMWLCQPCHKQRHKEIKAESSALLITSKDKENE
jgi:hypothetical protein